MTDRRIQIAIICEGFEEKPFLDKVLSFPYINKKYEVNPIVNAKGINSIFPRFQDLFSKNKYDLILIFCDVDKGSEPFNRIINKINNDIFGGEKVAEKIIIFSNPVTLQIVLSNFGKVRIKHISKRINSEEVEKLTGIKNYDAKQEQIEQLVKLINTKTYLEMKNNLKDISTNINDVPSTNFLTFLEHFENEDTSWVDEITHLMDKAK